MFERGKLLIVLVVLSFWTVLIFMSGMMMVLDWETLLGRHFRGRIKVLARMPDKLLLPLPMSDCMVSYCSIVERTGMIRKFSL